MTLEARVAKLCAKLSVEPPSGGGLAPTVRLCAAAAEVAYETIGKTVEALELEVFGVAAVAPAAATTPADKKKLKRAVKRETAPGSDDDEPLEAKTLTAEELAQQRYDKAKADGDVVELSDDDGEAKGATAPKRARDPASNGAPPSVNSGNDGQHQHIVLWLMDQVDQKLPCGRPTSSPGNVRTKRDAEAAAADAKASRERRFVKKRPAPEKFEIPPILRRSSDDSF